MGRWRAGVVVWAGWLTATACAAAPTTQRAIDRVQHMPNAPSPFRLMDFRAVAQGFDHFVYDPAATGEYRPLLWWDDSRVNMPERGFGLCSYVGAKRPRVGTGHEAITVLGSLLGATVSGIDKSAGPVNYAAMAMQYFNSANGENVVANTVGSATGLTYWYETFPQILFDCLADRYPNVPRLTAAMHTASDRWNEAYRALAARPGGLNFDHTAFCLRTMRPVDNGRWREPDGAAGIAWIQFAAYRKFGDAKYLEAAERLTDYLDHRDKNPLYEIDLPFGAYVAARLNAEHGDHHDVDKLLKWCFGPSDVRPGWGVVVGRWGDYDCSGLVGSTTDWGGYGFVMNTYAMGGCLVPLVRYDTHYARAVGKWMLNAMNSVRLCYPDELPGDHQSGKGLATFSTDIAYEGLCKAKDGKSPFAMGDALVGGWGETDLSLYGAGFVGLFGGIVSPTDDPLIPRLDLLASDFFHDPAYPTGLYYNPRSTAATVTMPCGGGSTDVYDTVRHDFIARDVRGNARVEIPPDAAAVLVLVPHDAPLTYSGRHTLAGGVVIDLDDQRQ